MRRKLTPQDRDEIAEKLLPQVKAYADRFGVSTRTVRDIVAKAEQDREVRRG